MPICFLSCEGTRLIFGHILYFIRTHSNLLSTTVQLDCSKKARIIDESGNDFAQPSCRNPHVFTSHPKPDRRTKLRFGPGPATETRAPTCRSTTNPTLAARAAQRALACLLILAGTVALRSWLHAPADTRKSQAPSRAKQTHRNAQDSSASRPHHARAYGRHTHHRTDGQGEGQKRADNH